MPLRPFPWPVNVGTDIVAIYRIRKILDQGHDNFRRYLRRFLTPQERNIILRRYGDADLKDPQTMKSISHLLAGRWAAKEATIKAVTWRRLKFHDIIIQHAQPPNGYVQAVILDRSATDEDQMHAVPSSQYLDRAKGQFEEDFPLDEPHRNIESTHHEAENGPEIKTAGSEVHQEDSGAVQLRRERAGDAEDQPLYKEDIFWNLSGQIAQISISHDSGYATAVCLAAQEPIDGDVGGELAARNLGPGRTNIRA